MQSQIQETADVIVLFPLQRTQVSAVQPLTDVVVPDTRHQPCTVVPLRRAHAAKRAVLLVNLRRLQAEIQALKAGAPRPLGKQRW